MDLLQSLSNAVSFLPKRIGESYESLQLAAANSKMAGPLEKIRPLSRDVGELLLWSTVTVTLLVIILLISVTRQLEEIIDPLLFKVKRFAPYIMQVTLGMVLLGSAHFESLFGSQLPLAEVFGSTTSIVQVMLYTGGLMLIFGIFPRMISFGVMLISLPLAVEYTSHMLTHATYIGEAFTIFAFGGAYHSLQNARAGVANITEEIRLHLHKYKFVILRIFLGGSLIISAIYSQFFMATDLETIISSTQLLSATADVSFILFGLIILQVLFGLFFIIGFEIRFASIAYLSFLLFLIVVLQEAVWQYVALMGTPLAMFTHGYDKYTVGGRYFSRGNLEPIL